MLDGVVHNTCIYILQSIHRNFFNSSVVGLNFDFVVLNIVGFTLYSTFNLGLYFIPEIEVSNFAKIVANIQNMHNTSIDTKTQLQNINVLCSRQWRSNTRTGRSGPRRAATLQGRAGRQKNATRRTYNIVRSTFP